MDDEERDEGTRPTTSGTSNEENQVEDKGTPGLLSLAQIPTSESSTFLISDLDLARIRDPYYEIPVSHDSNLMLIRRL